MMHVTRLTLARYRGAQSLLLELDPQLNVFVGVNGAGKSTVLDAAAILLSWLVNRIKHGGSSGRPIGEADIQNRAPNAHLSCAISHDSRHFEWGLVKLRSGYASGDERTALQQVSELARFFQERYASNEGHVNLPLFAYYPVNRAVLDIPLRIRERHRFDLLSAYDESLTSGANFRTFFEWFREREDLENENRRYVDQRLKPDNFQFPDPQLEAVREVLGRFLPEFTNLSVRRNPLRMEVRKDDQVLTVNQLSDGEKCLMAMIGDLARRMAIANPVGVHPLDGQGVILIDEIDLHLHPKWQRMVVPKLREVFPNCQFLISTHSPHVITHVEPKNLFLLRMTEGQITAERPTESYGKTVDRVLEDLMGLKTTRPDPVDRKLKAIFEQIDRGELDQARGYIQELQAEIGEDPELVKASVLIKRKELVGK